MEDDVLLPTASLRVQSHRHAASPRVEQVRLAHWMLEATEPRVFVQLGTASGRVLSCILPGGASIEPGDALLRGRDPDGSGATRPRRR